MSALLAPPGPIDLFCRFRGDQAFGYLGTTEEAPTVQVMPAYLDVKSDISGRSTPLAKVYDGEQHRILLNATNRFDWSIYKRISRATPGGLGLIGAAIGGGVAHVARVDGPLDRGSIATGSTDWELILRYQYGGTVNAPELPVGRRYYSCVMLGASEVTSGSRLMSVTMMIEANPVYELTGNPSTNGGRLFRLYSEKSDDVLVGLPAVS